MANDNPLMGSDEQPTTDPNEAKARLERRRKKLLETIPVENEANAKRKNATDDGNKREQDVHDEVVEGENYPFEQEQAD